MAESVAQETVIRVGVLGARGKVGSEVCRRLAHRVVPVRALVRSTSDAAKVQALRDLGVEIVVGDLRDPARPELLIAMSDQQHLLRLDLEGRHLGRIELPGGNPRQIRRHDGHFFVAHLADNWPADRQSRGFVSVLDEQLRVVANLGGSAPEYDDAGRLRPMRNTSPVFLHPHDLCVDAEGSLYVAQFASGNTYPLKFERV